MDVLAEFSTIHRLSFELSALSIKLKSTRTELLSKFED